MRRPFMVASALLSLSCYGTSNEVAPSGLRYTTNPAIYTRASAVAPNAPLSSGGTADSYSINPDLPLGLSLDRTTGVISGTPSAIAPMTSYLVTAINSAGITRGSISITVTDIPPSSLVYSANPAKYTRNTAIPPNVPSSSGHPATNFSVSPALPAGLSLDPTTGVISGTPAIVIGLTAYTVIATNSGGSTTTVILIVVDEMAPSGLAYSSNPASYGRAAAIPLNVPTSSGGPVVRYSVTPTLPAGLLLDPTTGVISGTPTAVSGASSFIVTAANSAGTTTVSLSIAITDAPPSSLTYPVNPAMYTRTLAIPRNVPSVLGDPVVNFAISPVLPPGLSLDSFTGVISGTPTAVAGMTTYTVTATNSGGSTTTKVDIEVSDTPCAIDVEEGENWPSWTPGPNYASMVSDAIADYAYKRENWRRFYQPVYVANGDYLNFAVSKPFAVLGPTAKWDAEGVPMVLLLADGTYHYNAVTISHFALYHHSLHMRGNPLDPVFWRAVDRLLSLQDGTGAFRYDYAWGSTPPGWASGMAQGNALSVLARAYIMSGNRRFLEAGTAALRFLLTPVEEGGPRADLRDLDPSLSRYVFLEEYSATHSPHTLNGFQWIALGLYDWAALSQHDLQGSPSYAEAELYFRCSVHTLASSARYFDVGGYSAYNMAQVLGPTAPLLKAVYHATHISLFHALYTLSPRPEFAAFRDLWAGSVGQPVPTN